MTSPKEFEKIITLVDKKFAPGIFCPCSVSGSYISMMRHRPSYCKRCKRTHDAQNPYISLAEDGYVFFGCRRDPKPIWLGKIMTDKEEEFLDEMFNDGPATPKRTPEDDARIEAERIRVDEANYIAVLRAKYARLLAYIPVFQSMTDMNSHDEAEFEKLETAIKECRDAITEFEAEAREAAKEKAKAAKEKAKAAAKAMAIEKTRLEAKAVVDAAAKAVADAAVKVAADAAAIVAAKEAKKQARDRASEKARAKREEIARIVMQREYA